MIKDATPRLRNTVSWLFIASFLITAPLLLLHTLGIRYNPKRNTIQSTGALSLISYPKGASVTLDGIPQSSRTPLRMGQLNPGTHTLELEKEGYSGWRKHVAITPGMHTVFAPIMLFPHMDPIPVSDSPRIGNIVWRSHDSSWIVGASSELPLFVSHLATPSRTAAALPGGFITAAPDPNDLALAVLQETPARLSLFFLSLTEILPARQVPIPAPLKGIEWIDHSTLLAWNDDALYVLTLEGKVKTHIMLNAIRSARSDPGRILVLAGISDQFTKLYTAKNDLGKGITPFSEIALSPHSTLLPHSPHGLASVFDPGSSSLALIAADIAPQFIRLPGVRQVQWAKNREELFMAGVHELQLISWSQSIAPETTLLTRVAEPLTSYLFTPALNAVFYTTPTRLGFIHLNPTIDQEPHTLSTLPDLEIIGADPAHNRLSIKKGEQLLSYPFTAP